MPSSYTEGKQIIVDWLEEIKPSMVVDVGPGAGTYWAILNGKYSGWVGPKAEFKDYTGPAPTMVAVEVYYPYVSKFSLREKYKDIVIADVRYLDWKKMPACDLVIFGDVLEHITENEALQVFKEAREKTKNIIISLPVVHFPQGEIDGNPFETHVVPDWTHTRMMETFGTPHKTWQGEAIGTYWYKN